jgi:hypothetical protein
MSRDPLRPPMRFTALVLIVLAAIAAVMFLEHWWTRAAFAGVMGVMTARLFGGSADD